MQGYNLAFGSVFWFPTLREEHRVRVLENRVLKKNIWIDG
jgi:hypothetical protein